MKKPLIALDSPLYYRRIIREINKRLIGGNPVHATDYPHSHRVISVSYGSNHNRVIAICEDKVSRAYDSEQFIDGHWRAICAERT